MVELAPKISLIDQIVGHAAVIGHLTQMQVMGRWPHALLFVGPSGIGKKKVALAAVQSLLCEQNQSSVPLKPLGACGQCPSCIRVAKKQSENLIWLSPSEGSVKPAIKIEAIRDVLEKLSLSNAGRPRAVVIEDAHTMNPQASNTLLKTLEEPFENVYFILLGLEVNQFLPTIRSRTQVVRFSSLSLEEAKKIHPGLADWAYANSRGQMDRLSTLSTREGADRRNEAFGFLEQFCFDQKFLQDNEWRTFAKDRSWSFAIVTYWLGMIRDLLYLKNNSEKLILNSDLLDKYKAFATLSENKLIDLADHLAQAEIEISSYIDPVLVFENLWVKYARSESENELN